ncbi:MAG: cation diffusion facilitator family transporter [Candidatus Omnitrophica bacterium]|nr:cation diffusion facilitator family transporter [Candidatus Omnitrophota bacterium]
MMECHGNGSNLKRPIKAPGYPRLKAAILITAIVMLIEIAGGIMAGSLALISDAGHMLTHLFALGMSLFAVILAARPATKEKTYGFYRAEVLVAFVNGIFLIFITAYLVYRAILRLRHPASVDIKEMLFIALIGLVANMISIFLLGGFKRKDLNIHSAFLHVLGDTFSSVAIVIGGMIMYHTKNYLVDPLLTILISVLILVWAVKLLRDSGNILLEAAPEGIDILDVARSIKEEVMGIKELHHLHIWVITSHMYALTAHAVVDDCQVSDCQKLLSRINSIVKAKFNIDHINIQFESSSHQA